MFSMSQRVFTLLALCLPFVAPLSVHAAEDLVINGSTTVLPIMQKAAENYMATNPEVSIVLSGGGSGNGIKALVDGLTTIAMSSRDIKSTETEQAKAKGVNPVRFAVAIDALVPVVHPQNPVTQLSLQQLRDIYAGRITNWKEVGGNNKKIVVISRDTSSGTYETWEEMVMHKEKVMPAALLQASNGAVVQGVSKNPNALGYIGIGYLNKSIKGLAIDKVVATPTNALNKQWPLARELYVFTNGQPTAVAEAFISYLLDPKQGQKAVLDAGFVPLAAQ